MDPHKPGLAHRGSLLLASDLKRRSLFGIDQRTREYSYSEHASHAFIFCHQNLLSWEISFQRKEFFSPDFECRFFFQLEEVKIKLMKDNFSISVGIRYAVCGLSLQIAKRKKERNMFLLPFGHKKCIINLLFRALGIQVAYVHLIPFDFLILRNVLNSTKGEQKISFKCK